MLYLPTYMSHSNVFLPLTASIVSLVVLAVYAECILPFQLPRQEMCVELLVFYLQNIRALVTDIYTAGLTKPVLLYRLLYITLCIFKQHGNITLMFYSYLGEYMVSDNQHLCSLSTLVCFYCILYIHLRTFQQHGNVTLHVTC
jgi:hypothetical protein